MPRFRSILRKPINCRLLKALALYSFKVFFQALIFGFRRHGLYWGKGVHIGSILASEMLFCFLEAGGRGRGLYSEFYGNWPLSNHDGDANESVT